MRRSLLLPLAALVTFAGVVAGCGDDDAGEEPAADDGTGDADRRDASPRFCDAYLEYLADSTPDRLTVVDEASDDPRVTEYVEVIASDADLDRILAATLDLDDLARRQCQPEWTAGAQGAGNTPSAAQAFFDALVAGDRAGARNVAAANALAVFDPWEPIEPDPEAGTPALADIGGQSFSIALGPTTVAQCEVETGVVVACQKTG